MKDKFLHFIKENNLLKPNDKILLAVSSGIDSMVMLHLFMECNFKIAIAHCNFCLRDEESDGDQEFIERFAIKNRIPIHINRFDTIKYADNNKQSIQMAARELRYDWFSRLAKDNKYNKIATGHNSNDVAETFLINLSRGTGIHGLTGITIKNGILIRPMLFASRKEIEIYAKEKNIDYREDSSNSDTKYMRNFIRHKIIPLFEKLNPSFLKNINNTTSILKNAEIIYDKKINDIKKNITTTNADLTHIAFEDLKRQEVTPAILFEIIQPFGFTFDTAIRMLKNISKQPGATYFSKTHKIIKDRVSYILLRLPENEHEEYLINEKQTLFKEVVSLKIERKICDENFKLLRDKSIGIFDAEKLKFPLKIRRWKHGDYFYPFGMRGKKKLSDYFNDQKLSIPEKENIWLLCSGNDIIWVINHRTDAKHCLTKTTKEIIQISLMN